MASKKRARWSQQKAEFNAALDGSHGRQRPSSAKAQKRYDAREAARVTDYKRTSCSKKKRYATRNVAEAAIYACEEHGTTGLSCYECKFCGGWHLTSKPTFDWD